jgi:hypothetical protein
MKSTSFLTIPDQIQNLRELLKAHNIYYTLTIVDTFCGLDLDYDISPQMQFIIEHNKRRFSIIFYRGTYGYDKGLLEIGDLDRIEKSNDKYEDDLSQVEGNLTAQDCLDIILGKRDIIE